MRFPQLHLTCILFGWLCFHSPDLFAQCPDDNQFWFDGQRPPCNSFGFISIGGGTYATFNVDSGMTYTFTTCSSSFNTMLTAYDLNGNLLFFNDDNGSECASDRASIEWSALFTGTIRVLVDSFPCTSFSATSAILQYRQTLNITSSDAAMCSGETRMLTATTPAGTFSGTGVTGNIFTAPATNGTYPITYTVGACSSTQFIQVNENPVVNIISPGGLSFCTGDSTALTANASAGSGSITNYQWKRNGVNTGANSPTFYASRADSYTVEATNSNGCSAESAAVSVAELQPPVVSFTGLRPDFCISDAGVTLTGIPAGGTFSGAGISGASFVPFAAGSGTHSVTYQYTASNGCSASQTQTTVVNDRPVITFNINPAEYCIDDSAIPLTATPSGGTFSGPGVTGDTFSPAAAGVGGPYIISYTFTDTIGCRNTASVNQGITVNDLPVVSISGIGPEYCEDATPVTLSGIPAGGTFSGSGVSGNTFDPVAAGSGTHQITYAYSDTNGCTNSQTVSTAVQPLPFVTLTGLSGLYCEDDAVVLMTGSPSGGTFRGQGVVANAFDPGLATGGPHTITYTYTDANGCTGRDSTTVTVNEIPAVTIIGLDAQYCSYETAVSLTLVPSGGQLSGSGVSGNTFNPSLAGPGNHLVAYVYSDNAGCTNIATFNVNVDECVGIAFPDVPQVRAYPNPVHEILIIEASGLCSAAACKLSLYNIQGQKVMDEPAMDGFTLIDFNGYPKGIYTLHVQTDDEVIVKKVAIR